MCHGWRAGIEWGSVTWVEKIRTATCCLISLIIDWCPLFQECKDADQLPDDELARQQWEGHLARNNSPIVDHCLVRTQPYWACGNGGAC